MFTRNKRLSHYLSLLPFEELCFCATTFALRATVFLAAVSELISTDIRRSLFYLHCMSALINFRMNKVNRSALICSYTSLLYHQSININKLDLQLKWCKLPQQWLWRVLSSGMWNHVVWYMCTNTISILRRSDSEGHQHSTISHEIRGSSTK
jgi:hypothetical protein